MIKLIFHNMWKLLTIFASEWMMNVFFIIKLRFSKNQLILICKYWSIMFYVLLLVLKCLPMSIFHFFGKYKRGSRQTANNVRSSVRKWTWRVNTLFFSRNTRVLGIATLTDDERKYSWMDSNSFLMFCVSTKNKQAVNNNILSKNINFYEYEYRRLIDSK